jgi:hypothetical protein
MHPGQNRAFATAHVREAHMPRLYHPPAAATLDAWASNDFASQNRDQPRLQVADAVAA